MSKLRFYRDDDNAPRAVGNDAESRMLAQLLESDIQDDAVTCSELLQRIREIDQADAPLVHTGNSFTITLAQETATIGNLSLENDEEITLDNDKVVLALKNWLNFIS
jgi:uncharacterized protein YacL (UPF0231 family)